MRFQFEGVDYELSFHRQKRRVKIVDAVRPGYKIYRSEMSKYPFTTATIREVKADIPGAEWPVAFEAEVGCLPSDQFSKEVGRVESLRTLSTYVPPAMVSVLWDTYRNRPRGKTLHEQNKELRERIQFLELRIKRLVESQSRLLSGEMET